MYSPELVRILEAGRESLNSKYLAMNAYGHPIDQEDWRHHLQKVVLPITEDVISRQPDHAWRVLESLYDVSLELFSSGVFTKNHNTPQSLELWGKVLPRLSHVLGLQPRLLAASLSNAVLTLSRMDSKIASTWVKILERSAEALHSPDEVLKFGQIAAWVSGIPSFRTACLPMLAGLSPQQKALLLGEDGEINRPDAEDFFAAFAHTPWPLPPSQTQMTEVPIREVAVAGNFTGLGGKFSLPPKVCTLDGQIHVKLAIEDTETWWRLEADYFGADFLPANPLDATETAIPGGKADRNRVIIGNAELSTTLTNASSFAFDGATLAVTLTDSFQIHLFTAGGTEP
jgi:hypothetical protein